MEELVSVIIPAYNHEKYINKCIDSVLNQTYKNLEVIVADDCSTDKTAEIIDAYTDKRMIKILSKKNKGVVDTINELMKKCTGKYIAIIGSDDIWYPTKIEEQVKVFKKNSKLGAVFTNTSIIDEDDNEYPKDNELYVNVFKQNNIPRTERLKLFYKVGNHLCHSSSMIKKSVVEDIGYYNKAYRQLHDYEYWVRLLSKYEIYIIDKELMAYRRARQNTSSISSKSKENNFRMYHELFFINYKMIKNMDDNLFKESFKDLFKNKKSSTKEELLCEKYFLLLDMDYGCINRNYAYSLIFDNENSEKIFEVLQNKFQYTLLDFYKETGIKNELYPEYLNRSIMHRVKNKLIHMSKRILNNKKKA